MTEGTRRCRWDPGEDAEEVPVMVIDCDTCEVRDVACADCVVTVLLGPPADLQLEGPERAALHALADVGLVPPLRLVRGDRRSA